MLDIRLAFRQLRATPVVTLVAVLSLALGIGANSAIFSIVNSLLLRSLPVERPDQLVLLVSNPSFPSHLTAWNNPLWEHIRDRHADLFQAVFAFSRRPTRFNLAQSGQTEFVDGVFASGHYFDVLGLAPMLGRFFTTEDDRRGGGRDGPVAVISYRFWQRRFGGAADVIGRTQTIDRVPFTIVGVTPPDFFGTTVGSRSDVILPIATEALTQGRESALDRTTSWLQIMARLKEDQTVAAAEQALRGVQPQIREATMPADARAEARTRYLATPFGVEAAAGGTSSMRARYRQPILAIMAVVALVLLIACANIANLFLARASARRHEFSVRVALGASRWRLARQQLAESLLLSGAGALAGLAVARWSSDLLVRQLSTHANTVFLDTHLDWRALAFTAGVAIAVSLLFGVVPAMRASRAQPIEAIREHGRVMTENARAATGAKLHVLGGLGRAGLLDSVVVGQVALSLVLVVAAGLFVRTFTKLASVDLGFDRDPVLIVRLDVRGTGVAPAERPALYERVADAVRATPGVTQASISEVTPVSGMLLDLYVEVENGPRLTPPRNISYKNTVAPGWFATYGTRLLAGRDFDHRDRRGSLAVVIVNETFARRFLPGPNPVGRRIRNPSPAAGEQREWMEVVGVVADATYLSLRDAMPATQYVPLTQQDGSGSFGSSMSLSVRAARRPPSSLAGAVAEAVARVDPRIAITFTPLKEQVDAALVQERIMAMLSGFFGALALLLAGLGLYGVTAYAVTRRRTEIGIRMALGAAPAGVVRLVLRRVSLLIATGIVIGAALSAWAARFVASLLYGLEPRDPISFVSAALTLLAIGATAGWLPARRAARIDPAAALRES